MEAEAPITSQRKLPLQRGDQGGRRAHDNDQSHAEMEQDAPVLDEILQGAGMQLQQTVPGMMCAERQLGATVQASLKAVQQPTELAVSSADLSRPGKNNSLAHNPESSAPEIVSSLSHRSSLVLLKHEGFDRSVTRRHKLCSTPSTHRSAVRSTQESSIPQRCPRHGSSRRK